MYCNMTRTPRPTSLSPPILGDLHSSVVHVLSHCAKNIKLNGHLHHMNMPMIIAVMSAQINIPASVFPSYCNQSYMRQTGIATVPPSSDVMHNSLYAAQCLILLYPVALMLTDPNTGLHPNFTGHIHCPDRGLIGNDISDGDCQYFMG